MLDAKSTFDDLIIRYSESGEQADRILQNRLYRNLTSALSGTQEYMAMEKLYELHSEGGFDLVVVDTPPTRHALDFVDAPRRLYSFLENRVFRLLLMPTRAYLKAMTLAANALLRTISRVAGSEIVDDAVAFFRAFEGMEEGFRQRARRVEQLLADPGTAFVLVAAPREDSIEEARFFAGRLEESSIEVSALVVNRLLPNFGPRRGCDLVPRPAWPWRSGPRRRRAEGPVAYAELRGNLDDFLSCPRGGALRHRPGGRGRPGPGCEGPVPRRGRARPRRSRDRRSPSAAGSSVRAWTSSSSSATPNRFSPS